MSDKNWLASKAMLASLNISQWSARRLDRQVTQEVNESHNAVADAGRYNKLLVAKSAIDPIQKVASEARLYHIKMTQPWGSDGSRILPAALYLEYTDHLAKLKKDFEKEVDRFAHNYPAHIELRKAELNGLFRSADYPDPEQVKDLFGFNHAFLPCPDANDFRVDLAKEHADDIRASIEERMKEALDEAMKEPVRRIVEVVGRMVERLKPVEASGAGLPAVANKNTKLAKVANGRTTTIFRNSLVDNVRELVTLLPAFNLTNNPALTDLTNRIERELCAEDAEVLRENEQVRHSVAASAEQILEDAKAFIA